MGEEQRRLLDELDSALGEKESALARAEENARALAAALDEKEAEAEELRARLAASEREKVRLADRVAALEAELASLQSAREALAEIQRLVS